MLTQIDRETERGGTLEGAAQPRATEYKRPCQVVEHRKQGLTTTTFLGDVMAVSNRTRFEVLRRDGHTCQYCGEQAPNVILHVDHVVPVSLGGADRPDNLVAACRDCNFGKSSVHPGSEFVEELSDRAREHQEALAAEAIKHVAAATRVRADYERFDAFHEAFGAAWSLQDLDPIAIGKMSLYRWWLMGMPEMLMIEHVETVGRKNHKDSGDAFKYFSGIMWSLVKEGAIDSDYRGTHRPVVYTESEAQRVIAEKVYGEWDDGYNEAMKHVESVADSDDFVARHIDGRITSPYLAGLHPGLGGVLNGA